MQKEQFTLLDDKGDTSMFAPIMIATLSTCAQLERENIKFRLNSGRQLYIEKGGKLGRKEGSTKSTEQKAEEYRQVIKELKRGISVRKPLNSVTYHPQQFKELKQNLTCNIINKRRLHHFDTPPFILMFYWIIKYFIFKNISPSIVNVSSGFDDVVNVKSLNPNLLPSVL